MFYSPSKNSFYVREIHGSAMPADVVEITLEQHAALMQAQSEGQQIQAGEGGRPVAVDRPQPSPEQRVVALTAAVQLHLDEKARELGYDDIKTAVTYAEEPAVARFQAEGRALRAWRSLVWQAGYDLLAKWQAGEVEEPDAESLVAMLPAFVPPQ
jgi:hypothetical protein